MTNPGRVLDQNIHDKSREGSLGGGFNTKIYMTSPGRVLGGSTPKHTRQVQGGFLGVQHQTIHDKSREGSWGGGVQHQNIHD